MVESKEKSHFFNLIYCQSCVGRCVGAVSCTCSELDFKRSRYTYTMSRTTSRTLISLVHQQRS